MIDEIHPQDSNLDRLLSGDSDLAASITRLLNEEARPRKVRSAFSSYIEQSEDKDKEIGG